MVEESSDAARAPAAEPPATASTPPRRSSPQSSSVAAKAAWLQNAFNKDSSSTGGPTSKRDLGTLESSHIVSDRKKWLEDEAFRKHLEERNVDHVTSSHAHLVEERKRWLDEQAEKNRLENEKNNAMLPTSAAGVGGSPRSVAKPEGGSDEADVAVGDEKSNEVDEAEVEEEEPKAEVVADEKVKEEEVGENEATELQKDDEAVAADDSNKDDGAAPAEESEATGKPDDFEEADDRETAEKKEEEEEKEEGMPEDEAPDTDKSTEAPVESAADAKEEDVAAAAAAVAAAAIVDDSQPTAKEDEDNTGESTEGKEATTKEDDKSPPQDPPPAAAAAKSAMPCLFSSPVFAQQRDQMEFFLPAACSCPKCREDTLADADSADPTSLQTILRPWQVEFLASEGITTAQQLVDTEKGADARHHLCKRMKRWRKKRELPAKSISCLMACRIWAKTAEEALKNAASTEETEV